tara:strand:- start:525 stop:1052 length:528 start_codon:yes stop_codon:yes gene_type:complete
MTKNRSPFVKVGKRTFRPESAGFAKHYLGKGVYLANMDGETYLWLPNEDDDINRKAIEDITNGVLNSGVKKPLIVLDDGGFSAVDLIDAITDWDDDIVIKNLKGESVANLSSDDYPDQDLVLEELNKALETAHTRRPHRINWELLREGRIGLAETGTSGGQKVKSASGSKLPVTN